MTLYKCSKCDRWNNGKGHVCENHFDPPSPISYSDSANGDPRFFAILEELKAIHTRKSADYGNGGDFLANVRSSAGWGISPWVGTMVRATDKIIRLQSLIEKGKLENESARDSLIDLASYAVIAIILMDEETS